MDLEEIRGMSRGYEIVQLTPQLTNRAGPSRLWDTD